VKAQDSLLRYKKDTTLNSIGIKYDLTFFGKGIGKPWHLVSAEYIRQVKKSSLIGRVNYAHRFATSAVQAEVEAYPVLSRKVYAYLNVGYSPGKMLFPSFRSGISLYFSLPAAFEVEAGARYLYFDQPIYIYTASIGKYYKKYWFNASAFLSPQNSNISVSWFLKSRYYLNDKDYIMLLLGSGISPDNRIDNTLFNTYLKSKKAELSFRRTIQKHCTLFFNTGISNQQIQNGAYINQYNIGAGFQVGL
jgi:YaiO family outer membrane protein